MVMVRDMVRVRVRVKVGGISFLKTVNTLLSESTEGRTRHKGGRALARTCIHHEVRSAEVPKAFFTCTQQGQCQGQCRCGITPQGSQGFIRV